MSECFAAGDNQELVNILYHEVGGVIGMCRVGCTSCHLGRRNTAKGI